MPNYRRVYVPGGAYFFTIVTHLRQPIFNSSSARQMLRSAIAETNRRWPFTIDAFCLLPDHIHCIWTLPEGDSNFSLRWGEIKKIFSKTYLNHQGRQGSRTRVQAVRSEAAIWQRRFWEHLIRDEEDFRRHVEYIHYNPVKHGLTTCPAEWPWSSFHRYVKEGWYDLNWGNQGIDIGRETFGDV